MADNARRTLTELEHDAAWHAIEGVAGEGGADPGTVLAAVLRALDIDPLAAEQHVHRLGNPDDDGGLLDDWDNCRDPECPGPSQAERQSARRA